ncbi:hypothetical protein [Rhizobacter sp. P5_C2]
MTHIDMNAPVDAGRSAAGFQLGMNTREVEPLLAAAIRSNRLPTPINDQLATGQTFVVTNAAGKIRTVFFGEHVCLGFNERDELFYIMLSGEYRGLYLARFGIGTPMKDLHDLHPLEFDEGDEMNYPEGQLARGISFGGTSSSLEADPAQLISCMTVHDWSLRSASPT